ncbi:hypothetical protein KA405_02370, partial [Patescibacteria group bacterium]|nr:hypothetical protein [Patescibacteria group bacterium]
SYNLLHSFLVDSISSAAIAFASSASFFLSDRPLSARYFPEKIHNKIPTIAAHTVNIVMGNKMSKKYTHLNRKKFQYVGYLGWFVFVL